MFGIFLHSFSIFSVWTNLDCRKMPKYLYDSDNATGLFPRSDERFIDDLVSNFEEEDLRTLDLSALKLNLQFVEYL